MKINFINLKICGYLILVGFFVFSLVLSFPQLALADRAAYDQCYLGCGDDWFTRQEAGNLSPEDNNLIFQECDNDCQRLLTPEEATSRAEGLRQQAGKPVGINPNTTTFTPNVPIGEFKGKITIDEEILGKFISAWYKFVVGVVGILAAVIIMWGGFKWLTSRGNSAAISDAKDRIWSAIIGLILVFLSYILLSLINPKLLNISLPPLPTNNFTGDNSNYEALQREEPQGQDIPAQGTSIVPIDSALQTGNLTTFTGSGIIVANSRVRLDGLKPEIMNVTQQIREDFGQDIWATSAYDPDRTNRNSQHIVGGAIDLSRDNVERGIVGFDDFMRNEVIGNAPVAFYYHGQPAYQVIYHGTPIRVIDETVNNTWHIDIKPW